MRKKRKYYDWKAVQALYDSGVSRVECERTLEINHGAWNEALRRGAIHSHGHMWGRKRPIEELIKATTIKARLVRDGLVPYQCAWCGVSSWRDQPLMLQLDHIDGNSQNNEPANLRLLCPNCHSQTDTFCGRNTANGFGNRRKVSSGKYED